MTFYEQISKYYDYIFPVGESQLKFISQCAAQPPKNILDVACGSGGYSVELAKLGHRLTAVDIESAMIITAKQKAESAGVDINAFACDMKNLNLGEKFDCIFCIGNSIVHLGNKTEILLTLQQMFAMLNSGGSLVLQIINYDRIVKLQLSELPTIRNEQIGLEFVRKYEHIKEKNIINFNTVLTVDGKIYENSVELLPLMSNDLKDLLMKTGFKEIQFYGDFEYGAYDENSYMLVVKAVK